MICAKQSLAAVDVSPPVANERPVNIVLMTDRRVHWVETVFDYTSADAISHVNRINVPSGHNYELLLLRVGTRERK